jgi:prepilin-type N-terminal cleavage/methylation domain-containing protein
MDSRNGFTLIEVLIVAAISAMLAALAVGYSGVERDQMALSVEETKISQFILQARSLAIATYSNPAGSACGYGVAFDTSKNTYSIFAYVPATTTCNIGKSNITWDSVSNSEEKYTDETWQVQPQDGITFPSGGSMPSVVLFYPPNPDTLIFDGSGNSMNQASIGLSASDGKSSHTISINSVGQVNF